MALSTGEKAGLGFLFGGLALAVGGGIAYAVSRKNASSSVSGLGYAPGQRQAALRTKRQNILTPIRTTRSKSGMVLREYRGPMPTEDRIRLIDERIDLGMHDPDMRKLGLAVTHHCPERDDACELQAVFDYVKFGKHAPSWGPPGKVRYTGDGGAVVLFDPTTRQPVAYEQIDIFQSPQRTLEFQGGDCDDHAGLVGTLLAQNGFSVRKKVTAPSRNAPDAHIYVEAQRRVDWTPLDTTLPYATKPGDEHPYGRASVWPGPAGLSPKTSAALDRALAGTRR